MLLFLVWQQGGDQSINQSSIEFWEWPCFALLAWDRGLQANYYSHGKIWHFTLILSSSMEMGNLAPPLPPLPTGKVPHLTSCSNGTMTDTLYAAGRRGLIIPNTYSCTTCLIRSLSQPPCPLPWGLLGVLASCGPGLLDCHGEKGMSTGEPFTG